jgi:hypothetical protein
MPTATVLKSSGSFSSTASGMTSIVGPMTFLIASRPPRRSPLATAAESNVPHETTHASPPPLS